MVELNKIYNEDCQEGIRRIPDASVDCILTDPPYLYLKKQKLERPFNELKLFTEFKRVLKSTGFVVMFGRGTSFYRWNTIIHDGNVLFFYPEDMDNNTHILLDWEKEQTGKIYPTTEEGMKDTDGIGNTKALAASGSEIAEKVIALDLCGLSWHIPTLQESVLGCEHKVMLNAALAICGKQPVKDDWYWCSTRKENKRNFVLDWSDGVRDGNLQGINSWVRPVSAASLNSL